MAKKTTLQSRKPSGSYNKIEVTGGGAGGAGSTGGASCFYIAPPVTVDPAIRSGLVAKKMRNYYELNRPHFWAAGPPNDGHPDALMLGLLHIVLTEYK